jgi:hypothetical protein
VQKTGDYLKPALAATAFALSSCADVAPHAAMTTPMLCRGGADCDRKWSRAAAWVAQNAFYKIETQDNSLIQTFAPQGKSPGTAIKVEKVAAGDGSAAIVAEIRCANFLGCTPDVDELTRSFAAYVSGASDLVVAMPSPTRPYRGLPLLGNPLAIFQ